jgi:hypothetical protein
MGTLTTKRIRKSTSPISKKLKRRYGPIFPSIMPSGWIGVTRSISSVPCSRSRTPDGAVSSASRCSS